MQRSVFYFGEKPNVHPFEQLISSIDEAREKSISSHFWIINEFCDLSKFDWDFDFDFLPDEDVWAENHINIWPSQHQKDSGVWLCATNKSDVKIYRNDVDTIQRITTTDKWKINFPIDEFSFDFSWHPDPTSPPYIYVFGNQHYSAIDMPTLEYHVVGASEYKYVDDIKANLLTNKSKWNIPNNIG